MKLLVATGLYAPDIGGPATYTAFLERHLPARGIDLRVVPFGSVRTYPKIIRHILYTLMLVRKGKDADMVYALDTVSVGLPALLASTFLRKPLYLRVPGDYAWEQGQQRFGITDTLDEYLEKPSRPFFVRVLAWFQGRVASRADRVIVPSEYLKRVTLRWGVDSSKVFVVHSAFNPVEIPPTRDELRARFKYEGFVVITAARLVPWKGIGMVIDVVVALRDSGILISLDIVGDGVERQKLEEQIAERGAENFVHLRGREEKQVLGERVKAADVFVLNTSYEGLSHQLLEVMDIGTPLVTTPVGGNVELIDDEKEGLLVPFNAKEELTHALERLRTDTALRMRLTEAARARVFDFREEQVVAKLIDLLPDTHDAS